MAKKKGKFHFAIPSEKKYLPTEGKVLEIIRESGTRHTSGEGGSLMLQKKVLPSKEGGERL